MSASPGSLSRGSPSVLRMAVPLVISFWMRSLFTFVDTLYASTLGDASVAAIGLSIPFEFLMIALWVGLSNSLTSHLSRAMGAREDTKIQQYLAVSWRLVLAMVPVFAGLGALCWVGASWFAPSGPVSREFAIYGTVLIGGSAFTMFWSVIPDSIIKAHHDTRSTMWAGIWSNVLNVVLNTIFTFVFHWGIFGIGLSTVLGRLGGLAYALHRAAAHEAARTAERSATPAAAAHDPRPLATLFSLAFPSALIYTLMALESGIINRLLKDVPEATEAIAAYAIQYRVLYFVLMPVIATAAAMLPYVARRFGEGDISGIRRGLREAHLAGFGYVLASTPIMLLVSPALAAALSHSGVTRELATFGLRIVPLGSLAAIPFFLCRPVFEGLGRGRPGLVMALLRYLVLTAPSAWLGLRIARGIGYPGAYGIFLGLIAATAVTSAFFLGWTLRMLRQAPGPAGDDVAPVEPEPAAMLDDAPA